MQSTPKNARSGGNMEASEAVTSAINRLSSAFENLAKLGVYIMAALDRLEAAVTANASAEDSALTLLNSIVAELAQYQGLDAKLDGYTSTLSAKASALSAAVAANTPAAPATASASTSTAS